MIRSPDDVPGWVSPEYSGGGSSIISGWWRLPPDVLDSIPDAGRIASPSPAEQAVTGTAATTALPATGSAGQNEAAESIDANFVLIGAAVVLGVILLTTGKD